MMGVIYVDNVPCIDANGRLRKLGAKIPDPAVKASFRKYRTVQPMGASPLAAQDLSQIIKVLIRNQQQHGSCTGHAGVAALDCSRQLAGMDQVVLSCTFPYAQVNGNRDEGAAVGSILQVLGTMGTCLDSECGTDQIYKQQIPKTAYTTAKQYMVAEAVTLHTYDELLDAINNGFPIAFGISVGNNFSRLDQNGVAPLPAMVVGGHALCGMGIKQAGNDWNILTQNSWGANWGVNGFCYLTRGHFANMIDAYALWYPKNINPPPPVAKVSVPEVTKFVADSDRVTLSPAMTRMMEEEDKKFLEAVNQPVPLTGLTEHQAKALECAAHRPFQPDHDHVMTVPEEESLMAQLNAGAPDNVTPNMIHTDPEAVVPSPRKKNRHTH